MQNPYVIGERIYLRGLKKEDLSGNMFQWANDPEVTHYLFMGSQPNAIELMQEEYDQLIRSANDVVFAICDKKNDNHIGFAGLYVMNRISRTGEFRIFIGEKDYWKQNIGSEAAALVIQYGFDRQNLNKIWLGVNAEHEAAVKSYEKSGFVQEGVLREEIYRNGKYYDAVRMSILRDEYYAK